MGKDVEGYRPQGIKSPAPCLLSALGSEDLDPMPKCNMCGLGQGGEGRGQVACVYACGCVHVGVCMGALRWLFLPNLLHTLNS